MTKCHWCGMSLSHLPVQWWVRYLQRTHDRTRKACRRVRRRTKWPSPMTSSAALSAGAAPKLMKSGTVGNAVTIMFLFFSAVSWRSFQLSECLRVNFRKLLLSHFAVGTTSEEYSQRKVEPWERYENLEQESQWQIFFPPRLQTIIRCHNKNRQRGGGLLGPEGDHHG